MQVPRAKPRFPPLLLALAFVVSATILAMGIWLLMDQRRDARQNVERNMLEISRLKVDQIDSWRNERLANAADVGQSPTFGAAVARWLSTRDVQLADMVLANLRHHADLYGYMEARLVDAKGATLLSTRESCGSLSEETDAALEAASETGTAVLTDLHLDSEGDCIHLGALAPVLYPGNGSKAPLAYVILISQADQFLYPLIKSWPAASETAETLLVRREGDHVLFLNELRHKSGTALTLQEPLTNTSLPATMAVLGRRGIVEGMDYRGEKVIAALQQVPDSPWFVVAKMDEAEAMGPATTATFVTAGLIAVLLLGAIGGVALFWQRGLRRQYLVAFEAERARHELTERFEHLVKNAADIILLADEDRNIIEANDLAEASYGYSREDLLGLNLRDLSDPREHDFFDRRLRMVATQGSSVHETVAIRKDGSTFPVEVSDKFFTVDGKSYVQAIIRDTTARKKAEADLLASRERYRATVEAVAQIVWVTGPVGEIMEPLPSLQRHTGASFETLRREGPWSAVHPEDTQRVERVWAHALANRSRFEVECRMRDSRGDYRDFWIRGVPTFDVEGQVAEWVGACTDVTERKKAETERLQLEKQLQHGQRLESLGVLAGGIAHDFNNILTAILGHADLVLHDLPFSSPARQGIQEIVLASRKASELCRQMLAYSGHGQFVIEDVDLTLLVEDMLNLLRSAISKKILLNLDLARNLPLIRVDVSQINQVIMNLVMNATEAIGERSGVVTIAVGAQDCDDDYLDETYLSENLPPGLYVWLEVADTGTGMDTETLGRLFEPFFTTKFTGRGLGLAAVLGIVRGHKGAIRVYSEPGKGSTLRVLFPAVQQHGARAATKTPPREELWMGHGTVLLADDEETIRALGRRMLERLGFRVLVVSDGREAVRVFAEHRDDIVLVILDLTMPHMNGEEAFREIWSLDPDARVIMSSGYPENDIISRFTGKGTVGFVQKPYTLDALAQKVRDALERRPA